MFIRVVRDEERQLFNSVVTHPLQSWEWGEFRKRTGVKVERLGVFDKSKLVQGVQITFHNIPHLNKTLGYVPKGPMPDEDQLSILRQIGEQHNALFIKFEPNVAHTTSAISAQDSVTKFLQEQGAVPGRPLFTKYTFHLDLTKPEEVLFANLQSKTRYNVNLASRKGVTIRENTSQAGMEEHIAILAETTKRQGFYAHTPEYFRTMWNTIGSSGMLRIFEAVYEEKVLVSWITFVFNGVLYYPYGSSRSIHREVMASNLMMWEMIRFGKSQGCTKFDMWGSLGPEPDPKDAWFGFHKFKQGYGGELVEFLGTYDLVLNSQVYGLYKIAESVRWSLLRLRAKFRR